MNLSRPLTSRSSRKGRERTRVVNLDNGVGCRVLRGGDLATGGRLLKPSTPGLLRHSPPERPNPTTAFCTLDGDSFCTGRVVNGYGGQVTRQDLESLSPRHELGADDELGFI